MLSFMKRTSFLDVRTLPAWAEHTYWESRNSGLNSIGSVGHDSRWRALWHAFTGRRPGMFVCFGH